MRTIILKNKAKTALKNGYPLLKEHDFVETPPVTTEWCQFMTEKHDWIGMGYLGRQHKGYGFIISRSQTKPDHAFFVQLFQKSRRLRQSYEQQEDMTNAYRLFNAEGDGLGGMTIDYYNGYAVISWYNETIYAHKAMIVDAVVEVYRDKVAGIVEKNRFDRGSLPESQWIYGEQAEEPLFIKENGVTFPTYLNEGWMTGIFLDQHEVRGRLVDGEACGYSVLNAFSYTGAFSVAAAMGGAYHTVSVDLAKRSLEKTKEVFLANQLDVSQHEIRVMDIFDYIHWAKKKGITFDMIILDPPSFARNGKKTFSVAKDYGRLVDDVLPLLNDGGLLIASTNAANVSLDHYKKMIQEAFRHHHCQAKERYFDQLPADFVVSKHYPEGNYLKVLTYEVHH